MYIKTERTDAQLSMTKISSKEKLINEIKTLSNTLSDYLMCELDITPDDLTEENAAENINIQNIIDLENIFENTEQFMNKLTSDSPIEIESHDYPWYCLCIELDENSKLKITAASDTNEDFTWDTLIQWFPSTETDEF